MSITPNLHGDARQVVKDFLRSNPGPGAPFWSVRHIAKTYNRSEHAAYNILKILADLGYLDLSPKRRASLKKDANLSLLGRAVGPIRPAFIWPYWKNDEPGNFGSEFAQEIRALCEKMDYPYIFLDNPSAWGAPSIAFQLKTISANALLALAPPASALILFARLKSENLAIACLGSPRQGYDELGVVTLDGDKTEAMRMLMLGLKSLGVEAPLVVGYGDSAFCHEERVAGLKAAYPEIEDVEAAGFFTNVGGTYSQIRELESRLSSGRSAPDALVFSDSLCLELAMTTIPLFSEWARAGRYCVAVFDETGLSRRVDFPIISITLQVDKLAARSLEILQSLRDGVPVSRRTLIRRNIHWPEAFSPK